MKSPTILFKKENDNGVDQHMVACDAQPEENQSTMNIKQKISESTDKATTPLLILKSHVDHLQYKKSEHKSSSLYKSWATSYSNEIIYRKEKNAWYTPRMGYELNSMVEVNKFIQLFFEESNDSETTVFAKLREQDFLALQAPFLKKEDDIVETQQIPTTGIRKLSPQPKGHDYDVCLPTGIEKNTIRNTTTLHDKTDLAKTHAHPSASVNNNNYGNNGSNDNDRKRKSDDVTDAAATTAPRKAQRSHAHAVTKQKNNDDSHAAIRKRDVTENETNNNNNNESSSFAKTYLHQNHNVDARPKQTTTTTSAQKKRASSAKSVKPKSKTKSPVKPKQTTNKTKKSSPRRNTQACQQEVVKATKLTPSETSQHGKQKEKTSLVTRKKCDLDNAQSVATASSLQPHSPLQKKALSKPKNSPIVTKQGCKQNTKESQPNPKSQSIKNGQWKKQQNSKPNKAACSLQSNQAPSQQVKVTKQSIIQPNTACRIPRKEKSPPAIGTTSVNSCLSSNCPSKQQGLLRHLLSLVSDQRK